MAECYSDELNTVLELLKEDHEPSVVSEDILFGSPVSSDEEEEFAMVTTTNNGDEAAQEEPHAASAPSVSNKSIQGPCLSETSSSDSEDSSSDDSSSSSEDSSTDEDHAENKENGGETLDELQKASAERNRKFLESIMDPEEFAVLGAKSQLAEKLEGSTKNKKPRLDTPLQCQEVIGKRRSKVRQVYSCSRDPDGDSSEEEEEDVSRQSSPRSFFDDRRLTMPLDSKTDEDNEQDDAWPGTLNEYDVARNLEKLWTSTLLHMKKVAYHQSVNHIAIHPSVDPLLFAAVDCKNALSFWKLQRRSAGLFPTSEVLHAGIIPAVYDDVSSLFAVSWMDFHPTEPGNLFMTTNHGSLIIYNLERAQVTMNKVDKGQYGNDYLCADFADHQTLVVGTGHGGVKVFDMRLPYLKPWLKHVPVEAHPSFEITSIAVHPRRTYLWAVSAKGEDEHEQCQRPGYLLDARYLKEPVVSVGNDVLDFSFSPSGEFLAARKFPKLLDAAPPVVEFYLTDGLYRYCGTDPADLVLSSFLENGSIDADLYSLGKVLGCPVRDADADEQEVDGLSVHTGCWVPEKSGPAVYLTGKDRSKTISIVKPSTGKVLGQLDLTKALASHGNGAGFKGNQVAATIVRHHPEADIVASAVKDHLVFFSSQDFF